MVYKTWEELNHSDINEPFVLVTSEVRGRQVTRARQAEQIKRRKNNLFSARVVKACLTRRGNATHTHHSMVMTVE